MFKMPKPKYYTKNVNTYITETMADKLKRRFSELNYPSEAAYVRRLLAEGMKQDYKYIDPDNLETNE